MIDAATIADLIARPGIDTRCWVSLGLVEDDASASEHSVVFNDDDGNALDHGVLVSVKLQPSGTKVTCRVGSQCAGVGEGEWHPMGPGDEVLVAFPQGSERAGGVIVARLNQRYDTFPRTVSGMDSTQNNLAFKRLRSAYTIESGTALSLRVSSHGAQLALDPNGNVFLNDGNKSLLAMTPDVVSMQLDGEAAGLHLDVKKSTATLFAGSTALVLDAKSSQLQTSGTLAISTGGNGASGHAITTEATHVALIALLTAMAAAATAAGATPLTGVSLGTLLAALATTGYAAVVAAAAALPLPPPVAAAITLGLAIPAVPGKPGLGAAGLTIG